MNRKFYIVFVAVFISVCSFGQKKKPLSPEATVRGKVSGTSVEIVYCRPSARDRKIMDGLVPYGEVWRTGANAATTIEFADDVKIEGESLPAGKYELFTIPQENEWTVIFQKYAKQWGAFSYKKQNDVLRVKVVPAKTRSFVETFTITTGANAVEMKWENVRVAFSVKR